MSDNGSESAENLESNSVTANELLIGHSIDESLTISKEPNTRRRSPLKSHFDGERYRCDQCNYATIKSSDLKRHIGNI